MSPQKQLGARAAEEPLFDGTEHQFHPLQHPACSSQQARMEQGGHRGEGTPQMLTVHTVILETLG